MSAIDRERWRIISPHFERALDMTLADRLAWFEALETSDPTLVAALRALFAQHDRLQAEGFLDEPLSALPPDHASMLGQAVGPYVLDRLLGRGGMGSVWLATRRDGRFEGRVAVKFLNPSLFGPASAERFTREGSILARLTHPSIAHLLDAGVANGGQPYLVLEYINGNPIDRYCDAHDLTVAARARVFLDVLAAVAHAHANLVVHRDIKPSNVFVRSDGADAGQVKLLDFGTAKLIEGDGAGGAATQLTREAGAGLTPLFAAPEQVTGQPVTTRTDVYSLGVLLHVLLAGRHPFADRAHSSADLLQAIATVDPPPMSRCAVDPGHSGDETADARATRRSSTPDRLRRALEGDLDTIVGKALKKVPSERYESVSAFAEDVRRYLAGEPVLARADSWAYRTRKWVKRNRALATVCALAIVATFTGLGAAVWQAYQVRLERDRAVAALNRSEAVTSFYSFMLTDAGSSDQPLSIRSVFRASDVFLETELAKQPENQAAVLAQQGAYFNTLSDATESEPRLRRALALLQDTADLDLRAEVSCAHAHALQLLGRTDEAIREAEGALNIASLSPRAAAGCHRTRANIARDQLDGQTADRHARETLRLSRLGGSTPSLEANALAEVAYAQQLLGRIDEADRMFAAAMTRLEASGLDGSPVAVTILNNWAIAILYSGNVRRALEIYRRAADVTRARDPSAPIPPYLLANLGRTLEQTGRFGEAAEAYRQTVETARRNKAVDTVLFALSGLATAHLGAGDLNRAEALLAETKTALATAPSGSPAFLGADQLEARILLARRQYEQAEPLLNRLLTTFDARPLNVGMAYTRIDLANLKREIGQADEAARIAEEAAERGRRLQGGVPHSRATGMALVALAEARVAQGRQREARVAIIAAVEHLNASVDGDHPSVERALALRSRLESSSPEP